MELPPTELITPKFSCAIFSKDMAPAINTPVVEASTTPFGSCSRITHFVLPFQSQSKLSPVIKYPSKGASTLVPTGKLNAKKLSPKESLIIVQSSQYCCSRIKHLPADTDTDFPFLKSPRDKESLF